MIGTEPNVGRNRVSATGSYDGPAYADSVRHARLTVKIVCINFHAARDIPIRSNGIPRPFRE